MEVEELEPENYRDLANQWAEVAGDPSPPEAVLERFEWWFEQNPIGRGVVAVIRDGETIMASAGYTPKRICHGRRTYLVAEIGHTMTRPEAQGRGFFSQLVTHLVEGASSSGVSLIYGTPNEQSGPPYVGRLGFIRVWKWVRWVRPVIPGISGFTAMRPAAGRDLSTFSGQSLSGDQWAELSECAWRQLAGYPHLERAPDYLKWRYGTSRYQLALMREQGKLVGWVVVGLTTRLGQPSLAVADIAFSSYVVARALLRWTNDFAAQNGKRLIFAMSRPGDSLGRVLGKAAFIPRKAPFELIALPLDDSNVIVSLKELSFRAGDSDTV